jgi:hypothetical protein
VVKSYIGEPLTSELITEKEQEFVIRHCVMSNKNGTFKEIRIDENLKHSVIFRVDLIQKNTEINNFLTSQIAIIFIKLPVKDENIINNINRLIHPIVT